MSMTPERIEEIKKVAELYPRTPSPYVNELLAALEEAQQQLKETEDWEEDAYAWRDFCDERNNLDPNEFTEDNFVMMRQELQESRQNAAMFQRELAEAQQTIANAIKIFETADAETDFDDVLHGMYAALGGNKEGSDKP